MLLSDIINFRYVKMISIWKEKLLIEEKLVGGIFL